MRGVKRFEGEEQVAEAQKRHAVATRPKNQEEGDLNAEGAWKAELPTR